MITFNILLLSSFLLCLGFLSITMSRRNVISILMAIELIILAAQLNFVCFAHQLQDLSGQVFALFVLTVAAAEAAIGLAIVVIYYRNCGTIYLNKINKLKG